MQKHVIVTIGLTGLCAVFLFVATQFGNAAIVINTNVSSLEAQKNLEKAQKALQESFDRLSSGMQINSASDDAEGLAVSENMRAQINMLKRLKREASDGVSMLQAEAGELNEVSTILTRMRDLAVQGANGSIGETDADFLKKFDSINKKIKVLGASATRVKLVNKPVSDIIKDAKEVLTKKTLTQKQRLSKIEAALTQLEKRRKDIILYATNLDKSARNTIANADKAAEEYSRWKR